MRDGMLWLLIAVYAFVTVVADGFPRVFGSPANLPLAIVIPLLFALFHGAVRYGWRASSSSWCCASASAPSWRT